MEVRRGGLGGERVSSHKWSVSCLLLPEWDVAAEGKAAVMPPRDPRLVAPAASSAAVPGGLRDLRRLPLRTSSPWFVIFGDGERAFRGDRPARGGWTATAVQVVQVEVGTRRGRTLGGELPVSTKRRRARVGPD